MQHDSVVHSSVLPSQRVMADYESRLLQRQLLPDPAQRQAVVLLAELADALAAPAATVPWWNFWRKPVAVAARGVYLWGDVGRGKTLLMDLFFLHAPTERKLRVHFHAFMRQMHAKIHAWRQAHTGDDADPIPPLAAELAAQAALLCFDEMQVQDVTDAMLIKRLFEALLARGVCVVITSNRPPQDLYLNGLQRGQFVPFIDRIQQVCIVHELASAQDYRRKQVEALGSIYFAPLNEKAPVWLDEKFAQLVRGQPIEQHRLDVQGRALVFDACCGEVVMTTFDYLCTDARGSADYQAIAARYSTVLLANIPCLSAENRNEAKRFVTLVDVLYEARVKLVCTAHARPDELYPTGDGSFEFARTASRLIEMQSQRYLDMPWVSVPQESAQTPIHPTPNE